MKDKILEWFANGNVGLSSKCMACCIAGIKTDNINHPSDPDDFNRCLLFLEQVPEARKHLDKLRKISPEWNALVDNWDKLEKLFIHKVGIDWYKGYAAHEVWLLMEKIYDRVK